LAVAKNHQIITGIGPRAAIDLAARLPKRSWQPAFGRAWLQG
jgi:hypothetical protein